MTERNQQSDVKMNTNKSGEKAYEGFIQAAGEDGNTERRHFSSSLPGGGGSQYASAEKQQPGQQDGSGNSRSTYLTNTTST